MNFIRLTNSPRDKANRGLVLLFFFGVIAGIFCITQAFAGTLEVQLKDHREAIGDFSTLEIVVDAVRISPKSGLKFWQLGWKELKPVTEKIDLVRYTGKRSATIFGGEVSDGSYEGIHLKLKNIEGLLKKGKASVSVKNLVGPIQLDFSISPKRRTLIVLDLVVLDVSDHPPAGYEVRLKGYELYTDGKLTVKIPPG
jgi:hypothetical protein